MRKTFLHLAIVAAMIVGSVGGAFAYTPSSDDEQMLIVLEERI